MCTTIATKTRITGCATRGEDWTRVDEAALGYDHATRLWVEHAVRIDFASTTDGGVAAVELDLASAKALRERLDEVIAQAEASGV